MQRRFWRLTSLLVILSMLFFSVPASGADDEAEIAEEHEPEVVLVKFKENVKSAMKDGLMKQHGLTEEGKVYGTDVLILRGKGKSTAALIKALSKNPNVEYAEPDYIATIDMTPNDSSWSQQWGPVKVSAPAAWDVTQGSSNVIIAVVDTGVDLDHPDLINKVMAGYNFVSNNTNAMDDNGHGTHVAGIAAAQTNNSTGVAGMCPNCKVLPVKVLNAAGSGTYSAIASGIRWAADKGAHVINLSLGGTAGDATLESAVNYANSKGSLLACAAGNSNTSAASYPAYYSPCVAVAASDQNDAKASFSNYGTWVDTSAPGVSIYATYWNNTYKSLNGTSMATPHVAGLAGLLFSQGRTQSQVRTRLTSSTYTDATSGGIPRRINAQKAVGP